MVTNKTMKLVTILVMIVSLSLQEPLDESKGKMGKNLFPRRNIRDPNLDGSVAADADGVDGDGTCQGCQRTGKSPPRFGKRTTWSPRFRAFDLVRTDRLDDGDIRLKPRPFGLPAGLNMNMITHPPAALPPF